MCSWGRSLEDIQVGRMGMGLYLRSHGKVIILARCRPSSVGALRSPILLPVTSHPLLGKYVQHTLVLWVNFGGILPRFVTGTLGGGVDAVCILPT